MFFYKNDKNYFEFVIIKNKFIIREVDDGKKSIVAVQERKDIRMRAWYTFYF